MNLNKLIQSVLKSHKNLLIYDKLKKYSLELYKKVVSNYTIKNYANNLHSIYMKIID